MLISVDCISEGFDVKPLRCGWGLRSTKSKSKFYQQLGRILRACEGKEFAIFLDQADNLLYEDKSGKLRGRFPPVEELREKDFHEDIDYTKGEAPLPRLCMDRDPWSWEPIYNEAACGEVVAAKALVCPSCGFVLPVRKKRQAKGQIIELSSSLSPKDEKPTKEEKPVFDEKAFKWLFVQKMNEAYVKGWHPGTVRFACQEKYGKYPPNDYYYGWILYRRKIAREQNNLDYEVTYPDVHRWLTDVSRRKNNDPSLFNYIPKFTVPGEVFEASPRTPAEYWGDICREDPYVAERFSLSSFNNGELTLAIDRSTLESPLIYQPIVERLGKLYAQRYKVAVTVKLLARANIRQPQPQLVNRPKALAH